MSGSQFTIFGGCSVFLLLGLYITISLLFDYRAKRKKEANCTANTLGRIIDYKTVQHASNDDEGPTVYTTKYYPIVVFNANGIDVTKRYHFGLYKQDFKIGHVVNIRYNPCNTDEFYIVEEKNENKNLIRSITVGSAIILGSILLAIYLLITTTS